MNSTKRNISFDVETLEAGQRGKYQDSYYHYRVTTAQEEHVTKAFCMNVLERSYAKADMPNWASGELLEFKRVTDNNKDRPWTEPRLPETYEYRTRSAYTG